MPIVPEKNGNKAGAMYVDGAVFTGRGLYGTYRSNGALFCLRGGSLKTTKRVSPVGCGYYAHAAHHLTGQFWTNGFYWYAGLNSSDVFKRRFPNVIRHAYNHTAALTYDVNPAIRLAFQHEHTGQRLIMSVHNRWPHAGSRNVCRFAASLERPCLAWSR
jgi:hypothetical protein